FAGSNAFAEVHLKSTMIFFFDFFASFCASAKLTDLKWTSAKALLPAKERTQIIAKTALNRRIFMNSGGMSNRCPLLTLYGENCFFTTPDRLQVLPRRALKRLPQPHAF